MQKVILLGEISLRPYEKQAKNSWNYLHGSYHITKAAI
jgi:hypothetical protein